MDVDWRRRSFGSVYTQNRNIIVCWIIKINDNREKIDRWVQKNRKQQRTKEKLFEIELDYS